MKIYTRRGDGGETGLFGGGRRSKDDIRVEAYGNVDELNSVLGVALATAVSEPTRTRLAEIQTDLFAIGAHLATPPQPPDRPEPSLPELPEGRIAEMESWIDESDEEVPPLKNFVLPGGSEAAAQLHVARTVCRRAERRVVTLVAEEVIHAAIVPYLNRLSDYLFAAARLENHRSGAGDVEWKTR